MMWSKPGGRETGHHLSSLEEESIYRKEILREEKFDFDHPPGMRSADQKEGQRPGSSGTIGLEMEVGCQRRDGVIPSGSMRCLDHGLKARRSRSYASAVVTPKRMWLRIGTGHLRGGCDVVADRTPASGIHPS